MACALCCPALTRTSAWDSALKRPAAYAESGFGPVDETALRQFGTAFEAGMDPDEVGRKIVAGLVRGDGLILTHPEFADDFRKSTKRAWPPCRRKRRHRRGWKSSACAAPPWPRPGPASPWAWPT
jgi:hypothetical protein